MSPSPRRALPPRPDEPPTPQGMQYRMARYKRTRYWGVYEGDALVVVTVYKRGAAEVVRRLQASEAPCSPPVWRPPQQLTLWADGASPA